MSPSIVYSSLNPQSQAEDLEENMLLLWMEGKKGGREGSDRGKEGVREAKRGSQGRERE